MCFCKLLLVAGQSAAIHYKEQKDKHALPLFLHCARQNNFIS